MVKIGVIKTGNIASSLILDLLLDERADREDIDVRVLTSGAKMEIKQCREVVREVLGHPFDLILYSTPNSSMPGPKEVVESLKGKRAIVISDAPGIKIKDELEKAKLGYIFVKADSMIGARREFLDPVEMAIFNADMLKVLAVTGALRVIQEEIDRSIDSVKEGKSYLPRVVIDKDIAIKHSGIKNPYAVSKAMAAYEIAEKVGAMNVEGCFKKKDSKDYIPIVTSAHELLRAAAKLADEVREIEKSRDEVLRKPHSQKGEILKKRNLMKKPS